tara:strand:- start:316 stop:879 length:564 start_codon:yes stop_codon:yes gene_type:complete
LSYIGSKPTNVPLTSADIQDGTINTADIADGAVTLAKTTDVGGANTPYFQVRKTSNQTLSNGSSTKIVWENAVTQSSSAFDLTNNKFTATVAGRYLFSARIGFYDANNNLKRSTIYLYKNNSSYRTTDFFMANGDIRNSTVYDTWIEDVSVNDYFEIYALMNTTDSGDCILPGDTASESSFSGFKLI